MRHKLILLLVCLLTAAAGCGGGDDDKGGKSQRSNAGDAEGAEDTVRDYLRALVDKDGAAACEKLTPEYQRAIVEQNRDFARKAGASDCASLVEAITREAPNATFEGEPLNEDTVDKLPLQVAVRQSGDEQNATVMGQQGLQRYELFTQDGRWSIMEIVQAGG